MAEEQIREFYSKTYRKEYKRITRPKKKHVFRDAEEAMKRFLFFKDLVEKNARLLDIGAGTGVFLYCLHKLGIDASGIEPDENHARYARQVLQVPVTTGFAQEINDKETFDIITMFHVLEHMTSPAAVLEKISVILKAHGYLIVEVPNVEDTRQDPKNRYHKAHLYTFNPETLVALGERAGFKAVRNYIAPFNKNLSVIFQKDPEKKESLILPDQNYLKIISILKQHNTLRHFTSMTPYVKVLSNLSGAVREQIAIRNLNQDQDIIDRVIAGKMSFSTKGA